MASQLDFNCTNSKGAARDDSLAAKPTRSLTQPEHSEETDHDWHICVDFIDPMVQELEKWIGKPEHSFGDLRHLCIFFSTSKSNYGAYTCGTYYSLAMAWLNQHAQAGTRDAIVRAVLTIRDESRKMLDGFRSQSDSNEVGRVHTPSEIYEDDHQKISERDEVAVTGFIEHVIEPIIEDLCNISRILKETIGTPVTRLKDAKSQQIAKKQKRSTERGEGRAKLIAALTKHHKYAEGGCLNLEPIGNNALAKLAKVSRSTASAFFTRSFKGHTKYRALCQYENRLVPAIKLLNAEFSPFLLYETEPSSKVDPDEEDSEQRKLDQDFESNFSED